MTRGVPRLPNNGFVLGAAGSAPLRADMGCSRDSASRIALAMLLFLVTPHSMFGATREAARKVQAGIAKQREGDFAAAEKAFAQAAKDMPENPRVTFDYACALAATGKHDEAEKLFRETRLARDENLVASSLYNLGCLAVARAKTRLGDRPEEAEPGVREESVKLLREAVVHYRECLATDSRHENARHNLELLRLWMKHMEDAWRQRDREKRRQKMDLLQFLEALRSDQSLLRTTSKTLAASQDSPRRRQASAAAGHAQRELSEEVPYLQEKIREAFNRSDESTSGTDPAAGGTPATSQVTEALDGLMQIAHRARAEMSKAGVELVTNVPANAVEPQSNALDRLDELYRAVAPFEHLLRRSLSSQERLTEDSRLLAEAVKIEPGTNESVDEEERSREQRSVANWIGMLAPKAARQLEDLKAAPASPNDSSAGGAPASPQSSSSGEPATGEAQAAWKEVYEKAVALGPSAHEAADASVADLNAKQWSEALSKQEKSYRLLKEIADAMPKTPPQDPPDKEKKDDPSQDSSGSRQQDQQDPSQQKQPSNEDKSQPNKEESQSPPDNSQSSQEQSQGKNGPRQPSQEKAESMLRQVRQREREYKQRQKEIQARIQGGSPVDKDW